MSDLLQRTDRFIQAQRLFAPGDHLLVGVSGGVDSMVLLHMMAELAPQYKWRLEVAHFNHRLRGRSSDADERLVVRVSKSLGLRVHVGRGDVRGLARRRKCSVEVAARTARHGYFARIARARRCQKLALAHHADDQVELFFLRLLRGSGSTGLAGMSASDASFADPGLQIVRPLLEISKLELAGYARRQRILFRDDASNACLDFMRNRIRNELIPELRKNYQPALERTILRLMDILRAESQCIADAAAAAMLPFEKLPVAVQRRQINAQLCVNGVEPSFDLIETLRVHAGTPVTVGPGQAVQRQLSGQVIHCGTAAVAFSPESTAVDLRPKRGETEFGGLKVSWSRSPGRVSRPGEAFDADRVGRRITLRHWRAGDRFQPIGMPRAVKLQDLFTNLKIPRDIRRRLVVAAAADGSLFWVEGCRMSETHKLTSATRKVLHWNWKRVVPIPNVGSAGMSKADE